MSLDIPLKNFDTTHTEADVLLQSSDSDHSSDTDQEESNNKRESLKRQKKEQTLYDWMSKSPASSSAVQSPMREQSNKIHPTVEEDNKDEDEVFNVEAGIEIVFSRP